ncbi:HalOD1 output domain-containing protein [Halosimplex halobium]|uniref:HalOD1 output domain-containing protein n=1 Tax=Halosimplex halobium TaxID=3396618 RepID=UPI003F557D33
MPASEDLYVLAPGEGEDESDGWVSPRPIDGAVRTAVADATDTDPDEIDEAESYVDLEAVAALLDGDGEEESLTFTVEGHEVTIDGGGHVTVDPE